MRARLRKLRGRLPSPRKIALTFAGLALLGPVLLILPLRVIDPPFTAMMLARTIDRIEEDKTPWFPRRRVVDLQEISQPLQRAILAAEDDAFYLHHGFDVRQIERAIAEKRHGGRLRGASTISQQTAKNLFLWSGRSLVRKGLEAYFTFYLELLLPKDRILELYLSLVECGEGMFGVDTCARRYFDKPAAQLGPEESARLAAVLPNPRKRTPAGDYASEHAPRILEAMERPIVRRD